MGLNKGKLVLGFDQKDPKIIEEKKKDLAQLINMERLHVCIVVHPNMPLKLLNGDLI